MACFLPSILEKILPFHLLSELAYQIKRLVRSTARSGPVVRIELPYDKVLCVGRLQSCGYKICKDSQGHAVFCIHVRRYRDLNPILGERWHICGLNKEVRNLCYAKLGTVMFHLHCRQPIVDFPEDKQPSVCFGGYIVGFSFVKVQGVRHQLQNVMCIP